MKPEDIKTNRELIKAYRRDLLTGRWTDNLVYDVFENWSASVDEAERVTELIEGYQKTLLERDDSIRVLLKENSRLIARNTVFEKQQDDIDQIILDAVLNTKVKCS